MVNVKGYIEACPVTWYHWTIFFQEFVSVLQIAACWHVQWLTLQKD